MRARKYNKRIQIWETSTVADGFGGNTVSDALLTSSWCNIRTLDRRNRKDIDGVLDSFDTLVITTRKRNDLTIDFKKHYIVYRSVKYIIQNAPINVGFEDRDIEFNVIASDES